MDHSSDIFHAKEKHCTVRQTRCVMKIVIQENMKKTAATARFWGNCLSRSVHELPPVSLWFFPSSLSVIS